MSESSTIHTRNEWFMCWVCTEESALHIFREGITLYHYCNELYFHLYIFIFSWSLIFLSWKIVNSVRTPQTAPLPFITAGTVRSIILKSNNNDQLSIYSISNSIHFSKCRELRPSTCHQEVIPGGTLKQHRCLLHRSTHNLVPEEVAGLPSSCLI